MKPNMKWSEIQARAARRSRRRHDARVILFVVMFVSLTLGNAIPLVMAHGWDYAYTVSVVDQWRTVVDFYTP